MLSLMLFTVATFNIFVANPSHPPKGLPSERGGNPQGHRDQRDEGGHAEIPKKTSVSVHESEKSDLRFSLTTNSTVTEGSKANELPR